MASSSQANETPESLQTAFDTGIWYALSLWPALAVAVANNWGGPQSADKRDWFAGAVSDLFISHPSTDTLDLESVLLQVMQDEFDVNVEDESEVPVAAEIMKMRLQIFQNGDESGVGEVKARFERRGGKVEAVNVVENNQEVDDDDAEWNGIQEEDEDTEMGEAPPSVPKEKPEPEVDEDGFTKVVGKKKR